MQEYLFRVVIKNNISGFTVSASVVVCSQKVSTNMQYNIPKDKVIFKKIY